MNKIFHLSYQKGIPMLSAKSEIKCESKEKISVHSLDYDGCTCLKARKPAFETILIKKIADSVNPILLVGSNRQSHEVNLTNIQLNKNGCCYFYMEQLFNRVKALNQTAVLDKFLMADLFGEKKSGYSFDKSLHMIANSPKENYLDDEKPHPSSLFDSSKITLIYTQMHRIAATHDDKNIIFNFYDDRMDILANLHRLFSENLDLIPVNVSLCFCWWIPKIWVYEEDIPMMPSLEIKAGQGRIDYNHEETIKKLSTEVTSFRQDDKFLSGMMSQLVFIQDRERLLAMKIMNEIKKLSFFSELPPAVESTLENYLGLKQ